MGENVLDVDWTIARASAMTPRYEVNSRQDNTSTQWGTESTVLYEFSGFPMASYNQLFPVQRPDIGYI
jgi:hypothetical protein